jgi:hypothetical protein
MCRPRRAFKSGRAGDPEQCVNDPPDQRTRKQPTDGSKHRCH